MKVQLARWLRCWADWLDPQEITPPARIMVTEGVVHPEVCETESIGPTQVRFRVLRQVGSRPVYPIYDGPSGARARDRFTHEKRANGPGRTVLEMDGVVRDSCEAP